MSKKSAHPMSRIRNIGVMAHIDAGKTTVTERILFITGRVHRMGEVHDGQAVMDWMPQEQERGITITSAVTTFDWADHEVHLIDTPGHVDFTMEVERSLRVLDGVITVLDGVAGVEAQTETVWAQADKFGIPRLVFINKLDRAGASFERCMESLRSVFPENNSLPIQLPIGEEAEHRGVLDLIEMQAMTWDGKDPATTETGPIPADMQQAADEARDALLEALSDHDDELAEKYLEGEEITPDMIRPVLRKATIEGAVTPVLCGSALKNKGIPPLIDAVVAYLPSPADLDVVKGNNPKTGEPMERPLIEKAPLCALAFKVQVMEDGRRMTYMRLYSGKLSVGDTLLNVSRNERERISRIFLMHSSQRQRLNAIGAGNIFGVLGLKKSFTGDTLTDPAHPIELESIKGYEPVVHQAVEPRTLAERERLEQSLDKLAEEDPTFRAFEDKNTGQQVIAGMGELHLEIITDRLLRQFKLDVRVGKPQVVFKETIQESAEAAAEFDRTHDEKRVFGSVTVQIEPAVRGAGVLIENQCKEPFFVGDILEAARDGALDITRSGPLQGYQMDDVVIRIVGAKHREGASDPVAYRIAAAEAAQQAAAQASPILMEPIMAIEVTVTEEHLGDAISSINERKGKVGEMLSRGSRRIVKASVPLRRMFGYSSDLRTRTQGRGVFVMRFSHYDIMQGEGPQTS